MSSSNKNNDDDRDDDDDDDQMAYYTLTVVCFIIKHDVLGARMVHSATMIIFSNIFYFGILNYMLLSAVQCPSYVTRAAHKNGRVDPLFTSDVISIDVFLL